MSPDRYRQILGIRFFVGSPSEAAAIGMKGGLVVVPAAPALVEMPHDPAYAAALTSADLAITDSGFMVLLWRLFRRERITRVSGLEYLKLILAEPDLKKAGEVFWIMPTPGSQRKNLDWLAAQGFPTTVADCYLAPMYKPGAILDETLLQRLEERKPRHIVVGLGGGVQEKLGFYLRQHLSYRPSIHCIGAAIGFLTGDQVPIPGWADYLYLGWLFRTVSAPKKFFPRYWKARKLVALMWRFRERLPTA